MSTNPKVRVIIEVVLEYELIPEHYPEGSTPQQMLDIDLTMINEDPYSMLDSAKEWRISGNVIDKNEG